MNPRFRFLRCTILFVWYLAAAFHSDGTSIIFPKFSKPILQDDSLLFTSPDAKRLLCVDVDGKKLWEMGYESPVRLFSGPKMEPLLQTGKVVSAVSAKDGILRNKFSVEGENDRVSYDENAVSFVSHDARFGTRMFKLLDAETGKAVWTSSEIENVVCATPSLIVCLTAERIPSGAGYHFGKGFLDAFDRGTFTRKWRVPLGANSDLPRLRAAFRPPYLIYAEGNSLTCLDCSSGRKIKSTELEVPAFGRVVDVANSGEEVTWLTSKLNSRDFSNSEHTLHFCSVPELVERATLTLKLIEIARVSFEGEFIITDSLYRTACFTRDGKKVWERFQNARTKPVNGRIYFSDHFEETTRIGFIDVPTGRETILYTEKLKD